MGKVEIVVWKLDMPRLPLKRHELRSYTSCVSEMLFFKIPHILIHLFDCSIQSEISEALEMLEEKGIPFIESESPQGSLES